jgi:hypothetical protein
MREHREKPGADSRTRAPYEPPRAEAIGSVPALTATVSTSVQASTE